jgi:hypothetical protein
MTLVTGKTLHVTCGRQRATGRARWALGLGVVLCAVCCSLPMLAALGIGGAVLASIGAYADRIAPVFFGAGIVAFVGVMLWSRRRAAMSSCAVDCACRPAG